MSYKLKAMLVIALGAVATFAFAAESQADSKPTIKIGYVQGWADSVATSNVAAEIIKNKLHYPVQLEALDAGPMWQGVARGDIDATLSAWLPVTHQSYYEKLKNKIVDLGPNFNGAKIGLVVPNYVSANSITDLNAHKNEFGGKITGIDAGAGIMKKSAQAIKSYGLDYSLMDSSGAAMAAELTKAENAHRPIIVTGWTPHWMFAKWKLKYLSDPKNVYGAGEHIDTVVNPSLKNKAPQVYAFLQKFHWGGDDVGAVMLTAEAGSSPQAAADKWIAQHGNQVQAWLK